MEGVSQALQNLMDQMEEAEEVAYNKLDDIPFVVRSVGSHFINDVQKILENENKKVKRKLKLLAQEINLHNKKYHK